MGRVTLVVKHLRVDEIAARITACPEAWRIRRWQGIRCAFVHPKPAAEMALEVGLARQTVHNLIAAYNRRGPVAVETPGHGQRQRAYLSLRQEQRLVERFGKRSTKGQVSTGCQFQPAVERAVGRPLHKTTVYRMLKRHHWRKVVPRRHPQADAEEQARVKKTPPGSSLAS